MRRSRSLPLVLILLIAFGSLAATLAVGNSPELGLDLQGGASVVLQPPDGTPSGTIDQAIEIIRSRVDALGVAEPDITRQGGAVVVELPGVADADRAIEIVGDTAELRFRPVLGELPPEGVEPTTTTTTSTTTTTTTVAEGEEPPPEEAPAEGADGGETATEDAPAEEPAETTTTTVPAETTEREENDADAFVVLPDEDGTVRYQLGPAGARGDAISTARAVFEVNQWAVLLEMTGDGIGQFNALAALCFDRTPECPTGRLAIELDGIVQSAPNVQAREFRRDEINITGQFSEGDAKDLALVLRFGALPVQLEQQTVRTVSATLGNDSLRAGLIAGAVGTALVLLYLVFYYRALGLVVVAGLTVWFSLQWSIISYLGATQGLALSLAGVTGIVVSVGVTVDSYVVYFERLKDELRSGRTLRSSIDHGFKRAFRTILIADTSAFLGAATLYLLTVGPVRGFAFFLGLSTILDVVVAWFFTRPLVALLGQRKIFSSSGFVGVQQAPGTTPRPGLGGAVS
jgi:preprotein translocase subunit SecD